MPEVAMVRRLVSMLSLASLLGLLSLAAAPVALAGDPCYHGFDLPPRMDEATADIKAMPCAFAPTVARIPVGGRVTFYNGEEVAHLVTGANQEWGSRDAELKPGQQVSYTFATAGIYPYACALHRGMSGVIIVGDVVAAGATGDAGGNATTTSSAAPAPGQSAGAESAIAAAVAGAAIAAVVGAAVIARRRRPVPIQ